MTAVCQCHDRYQRDGVSDERQDHVQVLEHPAGQRRIRANAESVTDVVHQQADETRFQRQPRRRQVGLARCQSLRQQMQQQRPEQAHQERGSAPQASASERIG